MNAMLDWLIIGVLITALASVVARVIPVNAPSHRYAYWWLVLAAAIGFPLLPSAPVDVERVVVPMRAAVVAPVHAAIVSLPSLSPVVLWTAGLLWAAFTMTRCLGLFRSLHRIRELTDASFELPREYVHRFRRFRAAQRGSRSVAVRVTTAFRGACAVGYRRPSILVSSALTERLGHDDVEAVILHEYAHLQRYDDWACLVQAVLRATLGLHPAVWWVSRQLDIEREAACDRLVVERTQAPVAYVRALTAAADLSVSGAGAMLHLAPGLTLRAGGFQARMRRLIEAPVPSRTAAWGSALAAAASLMLVVSLAAQMPRLVEVGTPVAALPEVAASSTWTERSVFGVPMIVDGSAQGAAAVLSAPARRLEAPQPPAPARPGVALSQPEPVSGQSAASRVQPSDAGSPAGAEPPAPELTARAMVPPLAPLVEQPGTIAGGSGGFGARAASVGTAAGSLASHAGVSIGRFFSRGGRTVAQQF